MLNWLVLNLPAYNKGEKVLNKMGVKISLYTVLISWGHKPRAQ